MCDDAGGCLFSILSGDRGISAEYVRVNRAEWTRIGGLLLQTTAAENVGERSSIRTVCRIWRCGLFTGIFPCGKHLALYRNSRGLRSRPCFPAPRFVARRKNRRVRKYPRFFGRTSTHPSACSSPQIPFHMKFARRQKHGSKRKNQSETEKL